MEDNSVEKGICQRGLKLIERLNLYTALYAVWIFEMYYLGVNAIFKFALYLEKDYIKKIPSIVLEYNDVIMTYCSGYSDLILGIAISMLICGGLYVFVMFIPIVNKYELIRRYSTYGVECGIWLFIIYGTFILYSIFKIGFLVTPFLIYLLSELLKKLGKYIEEKTGITFNRNDY